ncbi:MAG: hypothetical protein QM811_31270 [Pirellulales bacterium]
MSSFGFIERFAGRFFAEGFAERFLPVGLLVTVWFFVAERFLIPEGALGTFAPFAGLIVATGEAAWFAIGLAEGFLASERFFPKGASLAGQLARGGVFARSEPTRLTVGLAKRFFSSERFLAERPTLAAGLAGGFFARPEAARFAVGLAERLLSTERLFAVRASFVAGRFAFGLGGETARTTERLFLAVGLLVAEFPRTKFLVPELFVAETLFAELFATKFTTPARSAVFSA